MLDAYRKATLCYWERRRLIYNFLLIPAGWLGWELSGVLTAIDEFEPANFFDRSVLLSVILALFMANVCYSMVYFVEFLFMSEDRTQFWPKPGRGPLSGRGLLFIIGCILGMILAMQNMADLQNRVLLLN